MSIIYHTTFRVNIKSFKQIEGPKLKLSKAFRKNYHSIESKAFSKSTNNNKPSISFLLNSALSHREDEYFHP